MRIGKNKNAHNFMKSPKAWDSLKSCAAATKISIDVLRHLKNGGSEAFRGGRIYRVKLLADLQKFLASGEKLQVSGALKDSKLFEEIRRLKLRNDLDAGRLVAMAWVQSRHSAVAARVKSILRQKLEVEYPNAAAGLDVRGARVYGKRLNDAILEEFQKLSAEWTR